MITKIKTQRIISDFLNHLIECPLRENTCYGSAYKIPSVEHHYAIQIYFKSYIHYHKNNIVFMGTIKRYFKSIGVLYDDNFDIEFKSSVLNYFKLTNDNTKFVC